MSYPVKGVGQIQFYHHSFFFVLVTYMNGLLNKENIVLDLPSFYEPSLVLRDDSGEDFFESIGNDFGYNLVAEIAKGDGPESGEGSGPLFFLD